MCFLRTDEEDAWEKGYERFQEAVADGDKEKNEKNDNDKCSSSSSYTATLIPMLTIQTVQTDRQTDRSRYSSRKNCHQSNT